jgi:hypothetical protein
MEPSARALIEPLIKASDTGSVPWAADPTGGYVARIGDNKVNVYKDDGQVTLRILDKTDDVVDWLSAEHGPVANQLEALYGIARRRAKNIDSVVADILQHLGATADISH